MNHTYTNADNVRVAAFANQNYRTIGVTVSEPYMNHGVGAPMVDIELSYPEIVTGGGGRYAPALAWEAEARDATQAVIERVDACIAELQRHRDRLTAGLDFEANTVKAREMEAGK
jgi:hypothetical protein